MTINGSASVEHSSACGFIDGNDYVGSDGNHQQQVITEDVDIPGPPSYPCVPDLGDCR